MGSGYLWIEPGIASRDEAAKSTMGMHPTYRTRFSGPKEEGA